MIPVYSCRLYEKDKLVKNYIPCKNADGVEGVFDVINNEFLDADSFLKVVLEYFGRCEKITFSQKAYREAEEQA